MATTASLAPPAPVVGAPLALLLRLEGLAAAAISALLYARTGASWWLFAAFWLAPDLSMLGYLAGARRGASVYNAFHSYVTPGVLAFMGLLLHATAVLPVALVWASHIGVDRMLGYGLKYRAGFGWTHLGNARTAKKAQLPA